MSKSRRQTSATTAKEPPTTSFTSIDRDIRLIEAVKGHPVLYDPGIVGYKDHRTKECTWEIIGGEVDGLPDDCRNRWRALRDRFVREKKALLLGQKDSTFTGRKPKAWPLIDPMSFLWEFIMHRSSRGVQMENTYGTTLTDDQLVKLEGNAANELTMEEDLEIDETEEEVIEWVMEPETKRARQGSVSPPDTPIVTSASSLAMPQLQIEKPVLPPPPTQQQSQQDEHDDEDSLFCKSVAHNLRRLAPRRKALAKLRILQALYDAEFGNHVGPDVEVRLS